MMCFYIAVSYGCVIKGEHEILEPVSVKVRGLQQLQVLKCAFNTAPFLAVQPDFCVLG